MKTVFLISAVVPSVLFGALADKDWVKRTFAPSNVAEIAAAAAVTNAAQDALLSDMASKTWVGQQGYVTSGEIQYPVTDVRTGGVSIVSNGIADFTIPDVELPSAWSWVKGLAGFPAWISDSSPLTAYAKKNSDNQSYVNGYPGTVGTNLSGDFEGSGIHVGRWGSEYAGSAHSSSISDKSVMVIDQPLAAVRIGGPRRFWSVAAGDYVEEDEESQTTYVGGLIRPTRTVTTTVYSRSFGFAYDTNDVFTMVASYTDYGNTSVPTNTNTAGGRGIADMVRTNAWVSDIAPWARGEDAPPPVTSFTIDGPATNVIREVTGTFWDPGLSVTWRMFCSNGCFYVSAITNVNVTGVTP